MTADGAVQTAPSEPASWKARLASRGRAMVGPAVLMLVVSVVGFALRLEHAITFDGPDRGSDYAVYVQGVRWMWEHWRPFDFDRSVPYQVRYQPPFWYAFSAIVLRLTQSE